jgi:hypothetical protein
METRRVIEERELGPQEPLALTIVVGGFPTPVDERNLHGFREAEEDVGKSVNL